MPAPGDTAKELASVQRPVQDSFKNATKSLREVYLGHGRYQKLLDTVGFMATTVSH